MINEIQPLIPGWCINGLGLPAPNLSVAMGNASSLDDSVIEAGSVDIIVGCNVFSGQRSNEEISAVLTSAYKALGQGGEFSCTEGD